MTQDGDPLEDLGRELRRRVGHEFRAEAEDMERDAATAERRRRILADIALELVNRGDSVSVIAGSKAIKGRLVYARGALAVLDTQGGPVDINLEAGSVIRIDSRAHAGGRSPPRSSESLRSRLLEYEMEQKTVAVWAPAHDVELEGVVSSVGRDHVVIEDADGIEWAFPLSGIAWTKLI